jgi:TonB family protein
MNWATSILISVIVFPSTQGLLAAGGSQAFLGSGQETSAVDAKGVRHSVPSETAAPWLNDRIKAVAPEYPYADRARHHVGSGRFHLYLDLATGGVTQIRITKSTGFASLDQSAVAALRQWRWKPGRWKEIDLPVTFTIRPNFVPAPGSVRLPRG